MSNYNVLTHLHRKYECNVFSNWLSTKLRAINSLLVVSFHYASNFSYSFFKTFADQRRFFVFRSHFAVNISKGPIFQDRRGHQKGNVHQECNVGDGQHEDEDIRHRVHGGESANHVKLRQTQPNYTHGIRKHTNESMNRFLWRKKQPERVRLTTRTFPDNPTKQMSALMALIEYSTAGLPPIKENMVSFWQPCRFGSTNRAGKGFRLCGSLPSAIVQRRRDYSRPWKNARPLDVKYQLLFIFHEAQHV